MKRLLPIILLASVFLFYCSPEDNDSTTIPIVNIDDMSGDDDDDDGGPLVTYTANVASIISTNCLDCHGEDRKNGAPISFHTYELLKAVSDNVEFYMNDNVNPMPPESRGGLIAESDRAIISEWIEDGLLEN